MKEKVFEALDALYEIINPAIRYPDKEGWKEQVFKNVSNKTDAELEAWIQTIWDIANFKDED